MLFDEADLVEAVEAARLLFVAPKLLTPTPPPLPPFWQQQLQWLPLLPLALRHAACGAAPEPSELQCSANT